MKKTAIIIFLFSLLISVSCRDPYQGNIAPAATESPIATLLESEPEKFSEWVELLKHADMFNTMNLNASYTAFVPVNDGVNRYLQAKGYASVDDIPVDEAQLLVKYHTIAGHVYPQAKFVDGLIPDTTATGDYLSIEIREGGLNAIYVNGVSHINELDITVSNGVLHAIDDVLIPVTESIWDKINNLGNYTIMAEAIQKAGYVATLQIVPGSKAKKTLFAVPDDVYRQNGVGSCDQLIELLKNTSDYNYSDPLDYLRLYLDYHILLQQTDYNTLATFPSGVTSKNIAPSAASQLINVSMVGTSLFINYDKQTGTGVSITESNINTKNGIIHVVDNIMPVATPDQANVVWELTDYSQLSSIITFYRKPDNSNRVNQTATLTDTLNCYQWQTVPSEKTNAVQYTVYNDLVLQYQFLNNDGLNLNLGLYGWIEMQTPVIVKGTYLVKMNHWSVNKTTKDGKFLTVVDGNYLGGEVAVNGVSTTTAQIYESTIGTITFAETTSHTVRFIQTDNQSITLDYVEFIPAN